MAARDGYRAQAELLIRCLPVIANAPDFALKGGTAINLFLRDMPRLSVDIDLTYLPVSDRNAALTDIRSQLATIAEAIQRSIPGAKVQLVESDAPKLLVDKSGARIKAERRHPRQPGAAGLKRTVLGRARSLRVVRRDPTTRLSGPLCR